MSIFDRLITGTLLCLLMTGAGCSSLTAGAKLDVDDRSIERNVLDRLSFDEVTDAANLGVRVDDGVATLFGVVRSDVIKLRALGIVEGTPGVKEVRNEIQLR